MAKHLKALLIFIIVLGISLLIALVLATRNTASFAYNYTALLYLNIAVIVTMSGLLLALGYWLFIRLRNNVFGTRLLTRFALSFVLLAVVPSILLFFISTLFVSRTIDSWFGLKLDSALTAGIDFGRDRLLRSRESTQTELTQLIEKNNSILKQSTPPSDVQNWLKANSWQSIIGLNDSGSVVWRVDLPDEDLASSSQHIPTFTADVLRGVQTEWVQIEDEADMMLEESEAVPRQYIHALHTLTSSENPKGVQWIYVQKVMPLEFSTRVRDIQNGLRDYQATEASRGSLRNLYRVTLTIVLLVTLLAALAAAFLIANRMIQPILWLAQATRQIADGHYALVPQRVKGSDEMLQLVDSFGDMAHKLSVTQATLTHNQHALESAKAYSEAVLDNLSSGVLVLNQNMQLQSYNQTAKRMFHADLAQYVQMHLCDIEPLSPLCEVIEMQIHHPAANMNDSTQTSWRIQHSFSTSASPHNSDDLILSIQGSRFLAQDDTFSWVLVCDDVTPIISAQRTLAWGEVARRLAHEIKNPLTPIQLSAERLNVKLAKKLDEDGQAFLEKSTRTIVNQVSALQNMVDEFRDYARKPESQFSDINLNVLIEEILTLYESGQNQNYYIQFQPQMDLPHIWADPQQLRQILHNLIKNAIEAYPNASSSSHTQNIPTIIIKTELSTLQADSLMPNQAVKLSITDNGSGFSESVLSRMFEPYNSNKAHGTGLGLPIVKKILDAHHAKIRVKNRIDKENPNQILGAQIDILFINLAQQNNTSSSQLL